MSESACRCNLQILLKDNLRVCVKRGAHSFLTSLSSPFEAIKKLAGRTVFAEKNPLSLANHLPKTNISTKYCCYAKISISLRLGYVRICATN